MREKPAAEVLEGRMVADVGPSLLRERLYVLKNRE